MVEIARTNTHRIADPILRSQLARELQYIRRAIQYSRERRPNENPWRYYTEADLLRGVFVRLDERLAADHKAENESKRKRRRAQRQAKYEREMRAKYGDLWKPWP